jgi:hypothetical protein
MILSLKSVNKFALVGVVTTNLGLFLGILNWKGPGLADWAAISGGILRSLPAGLGVILIGIINAQLTADTKARIVFARWHNPLPGSRAFSHYLTRDPRIDVPRLSERFGPFPTDPKEQNAKWYGLYKSVENDPAVAQVHREYLFSRDYTCLAVLMFVVLTPLAFVMFPFLRLAAAYAFVLLVQFLLVSRAARHHGSRFVTTVLAIKASG